MFWLLWSNLLDYVQLILDNEFEGGKMEKWGSFRNSIYGNLQQGFSDRALCLFRFGKELST